MQLVAFRRAFTLLELLVVMSIIAALAGLTAGVVGGVRKRAKIATTTGLIHVLDAAVVAYRDDTKEYPFEPPTGAGAVCVPDPPVVSFYYQLDVFGLNPPYTRDVHAELTGTSPSLLVRDPWYDAARNNAIHYRLSPQRKDYSGPTADTDYRNAVGAVPGNTTGFNLWSFGPNQLNEVSVLGYGDDIANWKR